VICNKELKKMLEALQFYKQASFERRKYVLYKKHLKLEHDVSRLKNRLQAEKDLRVALEDQDEK